MMELDVKIRPKGFIETLRERLAELEELETTGAATADTCETLVDLQELLDKLYTKLEQHARKTSH
jgi:iron-sulfur cluster repair protein YtfE (RIC family)